MYRINEVIDSLHKSCLILQILSKNTIWLSLRLTQAAEASLANPKCDDVENEPDC